MATTTEEKSDLGFLERDPIERNPESVPDPLESASDDAVKAYRAKLGQARATQFNAAKRAASFFVG